MKNERYFVIGRRGSDKENAIVNYIAGEFPNATNACLFKEAHDKFYSTRTRIVEELALVREFDIQEV